MSKPKILSPTLREKKRYLAFEVISESKLEFEEILNAFWHSLLNLCGEIGTANTNIWFVKDMWNENSQRGVIRCRHDTVEYVRSALALIDRIGDSRVIINTLGVSGTMKVVKRKFFGERTLEDFGPESYEERQENTPQQNKL
ncbi:MAG: ribonuclease P protein component 2 [Candidatus Aenigmarchaeota archaeon]|nr:ribonuclease P protein component 2 [Candidatus Aenigmarchaeota archaeon]